MEAIFDYFLEQLNAGDLLYKGNYVFRFYQDKMTVLEAVTGKLVNEELEFSPVSVRTKQPIVFVENNKRIDWLIEFGILIRIKGQEYDKTTDLDYANIASVLLALQGTSATIEGKKYTFKTQAPNYQGMAVMGNSKYAIISCTLNVTQIDFGYFGQDSVWKFGTTAENVAIIDAFGINKVSTRRFYTGDKKSTTDNDYNKVIGRSMVISMTINYNDETALFDETDSTADLDATYWLSETFSSETPVTWNMTVESASEIQTKGGVKQITLRFVEI
jgi:hypothetical protein